MKIMVTTPQFHDREKVAFQGEPGAYSDMAAIRYFGNPTTLPSRTFREVFEKVESMEADFGIIPIENSTAGDINDSYDLLLEKNLKVVGELYLRVSHCLISSRDSSMKDIRRVYSHPHALSQCEKFLGDMGIRKISEYDTAGSVALIKKRDRKDEAAVASELAAKMYDMKILKKGIQSVKENTTRFFIIALIEKPADSIEMKTSIVFSVRHVPGAIHKCLEGFAKNSINLTKLVSRPLKGKKWEYVFYLDFEGNTADIKVVDAMNTLRSNSISVKVLGCYPKGK